MVAWVTVLASYATETSGTVTDDAGVQYVRSTDDGIIITLARGANAANRGGGRQAFHPEREHRALRHLA